VPAQSVRTDANQFGLNSRLNLFNARFALSRSFGQAQDLPLHSLFGSNNIRSLTICFHCGATARHSRDIAGHSRNIARHSCNTAQRARDSSHYARRMSRHVRNVARIVRRVSRYVRGVSRRARSEIERKFESLRRFSQNLLPFHWERVINQCYLLSFYDVLPN
jgi:hypothetical protein